MFISCLGLLRPELVYVFVGGIIFMLITVCGEWGSWRGISIGGGGGDLEFPNTNGLPQNAWARLIGNGTIIQT